MGKRYRQIGYIYCGLVLFICAYVTWKTDILRDFALRDIRQMVLPSLFLPADENSVTYNLVPLLCVREESFLYEGEPSGAEGSESRTDLTESPLTEERQEPVATPTDEIDHMDMADQTGATTEVMAPVLETSAVDGITYSMEQLADLEFLISNCYVIDDSTTVLPEELDIGTLLGKDMKLAEGTEGPKVLIYHTHGSEAFSDSREGVTEDTVIGVGDELARILQEDYGIPVYHDRTVYDCVNGELDRSYAYELAGQAVDEILAEYPSIEVVLDLHRDGVREDVRLVQELDGRPTAQIMFLNGMSRLKDRGDIDYLYNPYKIDNLAFSLQMHLIGKKYYGSLMRRIYVRSYCFNLNKMPKASLIEVGAQTSTVEEAKNAMIPLGAILYKVLVGP